jgi:hypothetical protein
MSKNLDLLCKFKDGVCNLSSVEFYDPYKNQWTMCSSMCAHEGVVGVGFLPIDVDLDTTNAASASDIDSNKQNKNDRKDTASSDLRSSSNTGFYQNKQFLNYYSLIEDEDDEDQYRNNAFLQQRHLQTQNHQGP